MAWLEQHPTAGTFQIVFRLGEAKFKRSLKTSDEREAAGRLARLEENICRVESGRLVLPEHVRDLARQISSARMHRDSRTSSSLHCSTDVHQDDSKPSKKRYAFRQMDDSEIAADSLLGPQGVFIDRRISRL